MEEACYALTLVHMTADTGRISGGCTTCGCTSRIEAGYCMSFSFCRVLMLQGACYILRPCNIVVQQELATIHIARSKTDQLRKGVEVIIARTGNPTCPVAMLEKYKTGMHWQDRCSLFRAICSSKTRVSWRESGGISYTYLREPFKKKLKVLGYNSEEFGLHSLRSRGAIAAVNAVVPDRNFKRHGRWKSENANDMVTWKIPWRVG